VDPKAIWSWRTPMAQNQRDVATRHKPDAFELEWNAPAWSPDGKNHCLPR
jgi:hypothetical protein